MTYSLQALAVAFFVGAMVGMFGYITLYAFLDWYLRPFRGEE